MALAFFGNGMASIGWSLISHVAPRHLIGLTGGTFNCISNLSGITTPLVFGYLAQNGLYCPGLCLYRQHRGDGRAGLHPGDRQDRAGGVAAQKKTPHAELTKHGAKTLHPSTSSVRSAVAGLPAVAAAIPVGRRRRSRPIIILPALRRSIGSRAIGVAGIGPRAHRIVTRRRWRRGGLLGDIDRRVVRFLVIAGGFAVLKVPVARVVGQRGLLWRGGGGASSCR